MNRALNESVSAAVKFSHMYEVFHRHTEVLLDFSIDSTSNTYTLKAEISVNDQQCKYYYIKLFLDNVTYMSVTAVIFT